MPQAFRDFLVKSNTLFPDLASELRELAGLDIEYAPGAGLLFVIHTEAERAFVDTVWRRCRHRCTWSCWGRRPWPSSSRP